VASVHRLVVRNRAFLDIRRYTSSAFHPGANRASGRVTGAGYVSDDANFDGDFGIGRSPDIRKI